MASCGDLSFNATNALSACFNEGGYTGRFWLMQWKHDQWAYSGDVITGNVATTPRMAGRAGQNVIDLKQATSYSDKTGTPVNIVTITFPLGWVNDLELKALNSLVGAGRLQIILERNGPLNACWFEVIGAPCGLLAALATDSGKKPEDFDVTEVTLTGSAGVNMIQLIDTGSYSTDYTVVIDD